MLKEVDRLRHEHNKITREVASSPRELRQTKIEEAKRLLQELQQKEKELEEIERERELALMVLPNIVHESVPVGDESASIPVRFHGRFKVFKEDMEAFKAQLNGAEVDYEVLQWRPRPHADMLENVLKLGNTNKAGEVAGSRFYYLFDDLVWLDMALIAYAVDFMTRKGFSLVLPPYMLRGPVVKAIIDFDTFKDAIYKVEAEDLYLISTAEHPVAALYSNENIERSSLPIRLVGVSPAFRREAGAANKDLKGIFRVHQFHKVEQFVFSDPSQSWQIHEELISNSEEMFSELGLPYRVINIASGDLGACAAKKYDLEVWMPAQAKFREMVSCSNCLDWQAYRLKIRYVEKTGEKGFVHTLNSTALATTRTITAILENYQKEDGTVEIPRVLRRYLEHFEAAPKEVLRPSKGRP
ncbi:serine--tRNA ligase [Sulfodiicoccus acidiphilus]|uniref:Serine--tRNA ligase n=2 Tax=Sulfodiicoccus acidiphilus TaxID=1670455 RepID=A0A348B723_9CREN|nr:serine--tRNA ligase [Sulfodiicoccus acidiphilus]GGU02699.1 serine--tRNA ligase [Sulfodiicoccus acidiphilus]